MAGPTQGDSVQIIHQQGETKRKLKRICLFMCLFWDFNKIQIFIKAVS